MAKNRLKKPFVSKQLRKLAAGCCVICGETRYELLDVHRIKQPSAYTFAGTVVLCNGCHRKHHTGLIKIDDWYESTTGRLLHWFDEEGKEHYT